MGNAHASRIPRHYYHGQTVRRQHSQRPVARIGPVRIRLGYHALCSFHRPDAVYLIQPTDSIARQHVVQQAAILFDTFGLIANVVSQIQAVVWGLANPSLAGTHADLNTVERWVGCPEWKRCH
jgi:hypothetical protein